MVRMASIACLLALPFAARAQEQERKLMDRVMRPDTTLGNPLQTKSFSDKSLDGASQRTFRAAPFQTSSSAAVRDFPMTRSFLGIKNPWFGGKVFDAKKASLASPHWVVPNAGRAVPVRAARAAAYPDAGRSASDSANKSVPVPAFIPQPAAQGGVSGMTDKINDKMTIDEVRELLNKPR